MKSYSKFLQTSRGGHAWHFSKNTTLFIGLILLLASGSAVAISSPSNTNDQNDQMLNQQRGKIMNDIHIQSNASQFTASPDEARSHDQPTNSNTTIPGNSATNTSNTTVTVNGQTTHIDSNSLDSNSPDGNTSYDKSYTDDSGSHVSISVHNTSSSSGTSTDRKGGATQ